MAKSPIQMPAAGGGFMKKAVGTVVLLAILWMIIDDPISSADTAEGILGGLGGAVDSVKTFITEVA